MTTGSLDGKSLADTYLRRVELGADQTAHLVKKDGKYEPLTWGQLHSRVLAIFSQYQKLGIGPGDRVCILSQTRSEWMICDLANLTSGIITVPIYQSNIQEDVLYLLKHCDPKLIFAEDEAQVKKLTWSFKELGKTIPVVTFNPVPSVEGVSLTPFETFAVPSTDAVTDKALRNVAKTITSDHLASIVYTSGTTGQPKGVMLTHSNFAAEMRSIIEGFHLGPNDTTLSFLPLAHILGRVETLMSIFSGYKVAFAESINNVGQNMEEVQPTVLIAVPRIYEKIYAKIQSEVAASPPMKRNIFQWATRVGREVARHRSAKTPVPLKLWAKYQIADRLVFTKIRAKFGGKVRISVSGGAPFSPEICEFFHGVGIVVVEGYGLTETTAAITVNRPDDFVFGTVGKPLGKNEFRIQEDGEIQVRGEMVFKGYYNDPAATKETLSADGWFATGDIGEISPRGFLKITDRKKELIVTSAGKNIAPQKIENMLKSTRFISQALIYGDKQKYLVGLITLNEAEAVKWAKAEGIAFTNYADLVQKEKVIDLIHSEIASVNQHLASYETVKKFKILPRDFTIEEGELTPSLKLKRKVVTQHFKSEIDGLY